jgi:hypothetical protein
MRIAIACTFATVFAFVTCTCGGTSQGTGGAGTPSSTTSTTTSGGAGGEPCGDAGPRLCLLPDGGCPTAGTQSCVGGMQGPCVCPDAG